MFCTSAPTFLLALASAMCVQEKYARHHQQLVRGRRKKVRGRAERESERERAGKKQKISPEIPQDGLMGAPCEL